MPKKKMIDEFIDIEDADPRHKRNMQIVELAKSGMRYQDIGNKFNLTAAAISYIAIKNGVVRRPELYVDNLNNFEFK